MEMLSEVLTSLFCFWGANYLCDFFTESWWVKFLISFAVILTLNVFRAWARNN